MDLSSIHFRNDNGDEPIDTETMTAKGIAMGTLFAASLLIGLLPFALSYWLKWNRPSKHSGMVISLLLAFGGGVLLATTFLHLLPEVRNTIVKLQSDELMVLTEFPLAEFLMCIGFFTIYFVSECVHTYIDRHHSKETKEAEAFKRGNSVQRSTLVRKQQPDDGAESNKSDVENNCQLEKCPEQIIDGHRLNSGGVARSLHQHSHLHLPINNRKSVDFVANSLRGLLIVLALSVHELFEGMALGLENSPQHVWLFFGAIASHKLVLAFCVGVELIVAKTNTKLAVCYILIFAIVSPIGIGIGMAISNSTGALIGGSILQAMATGTLLFVVFFEILKKSGTGLMQFLAVLIGFFVMFGLQRISKF